MFKKLRRLLFQVTILSLLLLCSGCILEALAGLEVGEAAALGEEGALFSESGLELRAVTGEVVIADEGAFFSELQRVKMEEPIFGENPRLYVMENGMKRYFGEASGENIIRLREANKTLELPGKMYRVLRQNVNVRIGPDQTYKAFKKVGANDIVLVEKQVGDWYQITVDKNTIGYINEALLVPAFLTSSSEFYYKNCNVCNGSGVGFKNIKCASCSSSGYITCTHCSGQGKFYCTYCSGKGYYLCNYCSGKGLYPCGTCNGHKYLNCNRCNGTGIHEPSIKIFHTTSSCRYCNGKGNILCYHCKGKGKFKCIDCYATGKIGCRECNQTGIIRTCNVCNGGGKFQCSSCSGKGVFQKQIQCGYCNGSGKILARK